MRKFSKVYSAAGMMSFQPSDEKKELRRRTTRSLGELVGFALAISNEAMDKLTTNLMISTRRTAVDGR